MSSLAAEHMLDTTVGALLSRLPVQPDGSESVDGTLFRVKIRGAGMDAALLRFFRCTLTRAPRITAKRIGPIVTPR
jgi:hypothetical protein